MFTQMPSKIDVYIVHYHLCPFIISLNKWFLDISNERWKDYSSEVISLVRAQVAQWDR